MDDIKVSVSVISYKHAPYLRQCLDSILAQKVNFKYQIVVGEDCSNDGSREILLEYKEKYPDIFVLLLNEQNMGVSKNSHNVKLHCHGQYITACESDDFWVDQHKMQKQVDFLDAHPEYVAIATNSVKVDPEGNSPHPILCSWQLNRRYTRKDFLRYGLVIHSNTLMYRNVLPYHDKRYEQLRFAEPTMGDLITRTLLYDFGDIYVTDDVTHAHRCGSTNPTSFSFQQNGKALFYTRMYFRIVDNLTKYFDGKYDLEPLKAVRMGAMLSFSLTGHYNIDKKELRELWSKLPRRLKWLSIVNFCRKLIYRFSHWFVRHITKKPQLHS